MKTLFRCGEADVWNNLKFVAEPSCSVVRNGGTLCQWNLVPDIDTIVPSSGDLFLLQSETLDQLMTSYFSITTQTKPNQ